MDFLYRNLKIFYRLESCKLYRLGALNGKYLLMCSDKLACKCDGELMCSGELTRKRRQSFIWPSVNPTNSWQVGRWWARRVSSSPLFFPEKDSLFMSSRDAVWSTVSCHRWRFLWKLQEKVTRGEKSVLVKKL